MDDNRYVHLQEIGKTVETAMLALPQKEHTNIFQTILRQTPWPEIRKHIKVRRKQSKEVFAIFWPDGRVLADSSFKEPKDAWFYLFGYPPSIEQIQAAKKEGIRVKKIIIDIT